MLWRIVGFLVAAIAILVLWVICRAASIASRAEEEFWVWRKHEGHDGRQD
jgi:hypothetical protein